MFEGGVFSCLEYLEVVPWADDEEEKVTALMGQLQLESVGMAADVMKRCSGFESSNSEDLLVRLLQAVTKCSVTQGREIPPTLNVVAAPRGRFCMDATVLPQLGHIGGRGRYQPNDSDAPIEAAAEHPACCRGSIDSRAPETTSPTVLQKTLEVWWRRIFKLVPAVWKTWKSCPSNRHSS